MLFSRQIKSLLKRKFKRQILHRIPNLLLTQKNVVVLSPENVVVENVVNVVDPNKNVVVIGKNVVENVVGGGGKRHWTALQAINILVNERPRREAWPFLARLYNEARTYFQSQI
jgi:hypothetical protein